VTIFTSEVGGKHCKVIEIGKTDTCHRISKQLKCPIILCSKLGHAEHNLTVTCACLLDLCDFFLTAYCINYAENIQAIRRSITAIQGCMKLGTHSLLRRLFEGEKCKNIQVGRPATCLADFEREYHMLMSFAAYFKGFPQKHNNNVNLRVSLGPLVTGRDTLSTILENYTGYMLLRPSLMPSVDYMKYAKHSLLRRLLKQEYQEHQVARLMSVLLI